MTNPLYHRLLPAPADDPAKIPPAAPGFAMAEGIGDFYLLTKLNLGAQP